MRSSTVLMAVVLVAGCTAAPSSQAQPSAASVPASGAPVVLATVNGSPITVNIGADAEAFVSLNSATNELWTTLHATMNTAIGIQIMV